MPNQRKTRLEGEIGAFVRQYARKRHPSHDPNDRGYDLNLEGKISRMSPEELDELMNGGPDDEPEGPDGA